MVPDVAENIAADRSSNSETSNP